MNLPAKIAKRIAGACLYSGCAVDALDDSDYCAPHDAHERGRDAAKKKRRRQRLATSGLCAAGCGSKVPKKLVRGRVAQRRCKRCKLALRDKVRERRSVPVDLGSVPGAPGEGNWRPDYDPETGAEIDRYRGKGRRGRLTTEEQLDELDRDLRFASEKITDARRGIQVLKLAEVQSLPPIQRGAAYREVAADAGQACRLAGGVEDELGDKAG